jgi:hypothetical protein
MYLAALHAGAVRQFGSVSSWLARYHSKAWPASWVSTSTSPEVPFQLAKMKGAR